MVFSVLYEYFYGEENIKTIKKDDIIKIEFSLTPNSMVILPNNKV